jgi:hypothetical protein
MYAALTWGSFDVVLHDPETPAITRDMVVNALRERNLSVPIITIDGDDVGRLLATQLSSRRN